MAIGLLIPIILGLGLSGCAAVFTREEEDNKDGGLPPPKEPPKKDGGNVLNLPCRERPNNQNKEKLLSESRYITSQFSGPFWSADNPAHKRDVFVHIQEDLGMEDPQGFSERLWHQATQCAPEVLKKLGITDVNPLPSPELNFFVRDIELAGIGGAVLSGGEILFDSVFLSDEIPSDNKEQCISPIVAHELSHLALNTGVTGNLLLNQPKSSVLEEGLATYMQNQVTAPNDVSHLLAEVPLDLVQLADQKNRLDACFVDSQESSHPCYGVTGTYESIRCCLENVVGSPTQVSIGSNGTNLGIYSFFKVSSNGTDGTLSNLVYEEGNIEPAGFSIDVYKDKHSCNPHLLTSLTLEQNIAQTACFVHDKDLPVNTFETGMLLFLQNHYSSKISGAPKDFSCGANGFSLTSYLTLEDGRRFLTDSTSERNYDISLYQGNLTADAYLTGACFWNSIDKSYPNNFLKIVRSSYETGLNHPGGEINVFSLLSVDQTENKEYIQALYGNFASHNIPVDIFTDQLLPPFCD